MRKLLIALALALPQLALAHCWRLPDGRVIALDPPAVPAVIGAQPLACQAECEAQPPGTSGTPGAPPQSCLRVAPQCPYATYWDGQQCRSICTAGTVFNGLYCACPLGSLWTGSYCRSFSAPLIGDFPDIPIRR